MTPADLIDDLVADAEEAERYWKCITWLFSMVLDRPMPDEIALRLVQQYDGDLAKVQAALSTITDVIDLFTETMLLRAAIQIKQGGKNGTQAE